MDRYTGSQPLKNTKKAIHKNIRSVISGSFHSQIYEAGQYKINLIWCQRRVFRVHPNCWERFNRLKIRQNINMLTKRKQFVKSPSNFLQKILNFTGPSFERSYLRKLKIKKALKFRRHKRTIAFLHVQKLSNMYKQILQQLPQLKNGIDKPCLWSSYRPLLNKYKDCSDYKSVQDILSYAYQYAYNDNAGEFHKQKAFVCYHQSKYQKGLYHIKECINLCPDSAMAYAIYGQLQIANKNYNKGHQLLIKATHLDKKCDFAWAMLGKYYFLNSDWKNARQALINSVSTYPNWHSYSVLATISAQYGLYEDCIKYAQLSLSLKPEDHPTLRNLCFALSKLRRFHQLLKIVQGKIEQNQHRSDCYYYYAGMACYGLVQRDKSVKYFDKLLQSKNPSYETLSQKYFANIYVGKSMDSVNIIISLLQHPQSNKFKGLAIHAAMIYDQAGIVDKKQSQTKIMREFQLYNQRKKNIVANFQLSLFYLLIQQKLKSYSGISEFFQNMMKAFDQNIQQMNITRRQLVMIFQEVKIIYPPYRHHTWLIEGLFWRYFSSKQNSRFCYKSVCQLYMKDQSIFISKFELFNKIYEKYIRLYSKKTRELFCSYFLSETFEENEAEGNKLMLDMIKKQSNFQSLKIFRNKLSVLYEKAKNNLVKQVQKLIQLRQKNREGSLSQTSQNNEEIVKIQAIILRHFNLIRVEKRQQKIRMFLGKINSLIHLNSRPLIDLQNNNQLGNLVSPSQIFAEEIAQELIRISEESQKKLFIKKHFFEVYFLVEIKKTLINSLSPYCYTQVICNLLTEQLSKIQVNTTIDLKKICESTCNLIFDIKHNNEQQYCIVDFFEVNNSNFSKMDQPEFEDSGKYEKKVTFSNSASTATTDFSKQYVIKNVLELASYLSMNKQQNQYIIKQYYERDEKIISSVSAKKPQQYVIKCEYGQARTCSQTMKLFIWKLGQLQVLGWISNIARGISQLQRMGIIYLDQAINNTVKVGDRFKIIDFGVSFKVKRAIGDSQEEQAYKHTRNYIEHLFQSLNEESFEKQLKCLFPKCDGEKESYDYEKIIKDMINKLKKYKGNQSRFVEICLEKLWKYGKRCHLFHFIKIVKKMLNGQTQSIQFPIKQNQVNLNEQNQEIQLPLKQTEVNYIQSLLRSLAKKQINYSQFAHQIDQIKKPSN